MKITALLLMIVLCSARTAPAEQDEYGIGIGDRLHITGEGGVAFFDTEEEGEFPNNEFRVDEAKLFIEASIVEDIYVFAEIDFLLREEPDEPLQLGELYIEFEDVGNKNGFFNFRLGRFGTTRTVDVHVTHLRQKLSILADAITTVKPLGYKLKEL